MEFREAEQKDVAVICELVAAASFCSASLNSIFLPL